MFKYRVPAARIMNNGSATLGFGTNTVIVNATGVGFGIVTSIYETATLTGASIRLHAKAGTPGLLQLSLQTVGTDGKPTGTILNGGNAKGTVDITGVTAGTWADVTFTSATTVNRGDVFALVAEGVTGGGTWSGTNTATLTTNISSFDEGTSFPYWATLSGGVYTKSNQRQHECYKLVSSTKTYGMPIRVAETNSPAITSTSEVGLKFNLPTTYGRFFRVVGAFATYTIQNFGTSYDFNMNLYDWNGGANSTALQSVTRNNQQFIDNANVRGSAEILFDETNLTVLETNKDYILSFSTTLTTAPIAVTYLSVTDFDKSAFFDGTWDYVNRTSATGSWSTTADRWISLELLIEDMTHVLVHPGMTGGMRG